MKKRWIKTIAISLAAVIVVGTGSYFGYTKVVASKNKSTTTLMLTPVTVKKGNISVSISGSGTVTNSSQTDLSFSGSGTIDNLPFKEGDTIKQGDVIAHIVDTAAAQTVTAKQNALTAANSALAQSQKNLNSLYIKTPVSGRVKSVTVSQGDDLSLMKTLGNIAVISTDGQMKTTINTNVSVNAGDTVNVDYNGTVVQGTVTSSSVQATSQGSNKTTTAGSTGGSVSVIIGRDDFPVGASATVSKQDGTVLGTGTLAVNSPVNISGPGNGTISEVYVSENSTVSKNDNLFKLNGDSVQSDIDSKQQNVAQAQADLANAQASVAKDSITSPVNGIIAALNYKIGDTVSNGKAVATVLDPTQMQTVVTVDELDIQNVKVGQKADISLDAMPGKTFTGQVTKVAAIGTASNGVTNYNVTVSIANPTNIKVGMSTSVNIITQSKENVLVVSSRALQNKRGTSAVVITPDGLLDSNGKETKEAQSKTLADVLSTNGKRVTLGMSTSSNVEITGGVNEGDQILIAVQVTKAKTTSNSTNQNNQRQNGYTGAGGFGGGNFGGGAAGGNFSGGSAGGGTTTRTKGN